MPFAIYYNALDVTKIPKDAVPPDESLSKSKHESQKINGHHETVRSGKARRLKHGTV